MRAAAVLSIAAAVTSHARGEETATVQGKVELPKATAIAPAAARYQTENIPIGKPEPPTAVVYLEGKFPRVAPTHLAKMPQKNLQFTKGLLPIQKGTTVEFPNLDDTYHNVFS